MLQFLVKLRIKGIRVQISPWAALALNALYLLLTGLTLPIVDSLGFGNHDAQVVAWAGFLAIPLNMLMHAFSSSTPGPAAPADPPVVKAAQAVADLPPNVPETSPRVVIAKAIATRAIADHQP
jgi:hypothetical protein